MERSFAHEIESLKLGDDDVFRSEGGLAVPKALLRSGVSHIGEYQGAQVPHWLMDPRPDQETGEDAPGGVPVAFTPLRGEPANVH